MAGVLSVMPLTVAAAASVGAVAVWTVRTVRKPPPATDPPSRTPRLALTAPEIGAFVLVVAAAAALAWRSVTSLTTSVEEVALLLLPGAALLRAYRLARAGSPAVHRLAGVLALVAGSALLVGGLVWMTIAVFRLRSLGAVDLGAGLLAVAGAALWLRTPPR